MMFKLGLLMVLMFAFFGANMSNSMTPQQIDNVTLRVYDTLENNTFKMQGDDVNATFLERALGKLGDLYFFIAATGMRESVNYGYNNPTKAYQYIMWFLIISLMAPLIIPLFYLIGLSYYALAWIMEKFKKGG